MASHTYFSERSCSDRVPRRFTRIIRSIAISSVLGAPRRAWERVHRRFGRGESRTTLLSHGSRGSWISDVSWPESSGSVTTFSSLSSEDSETLVPSDSPVSPLIPELPAVSPLPRNSSPVELEGREQWTHFTERLAAAALEGSRQKLTTAMTVVRLGVESGFIHRDELEELIQVHSMLEACCYRLAQSGLAVSSQVPPPLYSG